MTNPIRPLYVVIPAAGRGSRMKSDIPKVLHVVGDQPIIVHVIKKARFFSPERIIVVESADKSISNVVTDDDVVFVTQSQPNGVAPAVMAALTEIAGPSDVLILLGDSPLIDTEAVKSAVRKHQAERNALTLLTGSSTEDYPYSHVERTTDGAVAALALGASVPGKKEYSLGPLIADSEVLRRFLPQIQPIRGELRLEGLVELLVKAGLVVGAHAIPFAPNLWGINDPLDLANAQRLVRMRRNSN